MAEEGMKTTPNQLIHIGKPIMFDTCQFLEKLDGLAKASYNNQENICELVAETVPTFRYGKKSEEIKKSTDKVYRTLLQDGKKKVILDL